jgi:hypothetical protein
MSRQRFSVPTPKVATRRPERLAINVVDLGRLPPIIRQCLDLANQVNLQSVIRVDEDRFDEAAVEFTCALVQAASICDIIRIEDRKRKQYPTRVYLCRDTAWTRLPGDVALAFSGDEECELNPDVFKDKANDMNSTA